MIRCLATLLAVALAHPGCGSGSESDDPCVSYAQDLADKSEACHIEKLTIEMDLTHCTDAEKETAACAADCFSDLTCAGIRGQDEENFDAYRDCLDTCPEPP